MLRRRTPKVCSLLVAQRSETLDTATFSAPRARDDSWISPSRGRPPGLCKAVDRRAGELQRLRNGPPILPDAPGEPALAARSSSCRPSSFVRARQLRSRPRRPLPETARAQPAPLPLPVAGPASSAPLRRPAGKAAAVWWPICVVADWLPAASVSNAHLACRWSLSGGADSSVVQGCCYHCLGRRFHKGCNDEKDKMYYNWQMFFGARLWPHLIIIVAPQLALFSRNNY